MFQSAQQRRSASSAVAVDIAPLIDIVFILLIFFLVTTTFTRDIGIEITRPEATQSRALNPEALRIGVAAGGAIYIDGAAVDVVGVAREVRVFLETSPDGGIVVVPDEQAPAGRVVAVVDEAKRAGATQVALATRREGGP